MGDMGESITIIGGRPLRGAVQIPAAKNSVLPLLAACLLCRGPVRLRAVPRLSDVEVCLSLLRSAGMSACRAGEDILVEGTPCTVRLPRQQSEKMRASILFAAPLLARLGRVETVLPGGCRIGARPVDLHIKGLAALGAQVQPAGEGQLVLAAPRGLHGAEYALPFPSVGATETLLLAAATARGDTTLHGAACEPEIADLARFLNACGACIEGAGTPTVRISGRRALGGCAFSPLPDRIFASTLACAVAAAGGCIELRGVQGATFAPLLALLRRAGCTVEETHAGAGSIAVARFGRLNGVGQVRTAVYPGFATDAAPLAAAALLGAAGPSCIEDAVFEHRFACAEGFARMGARVQVRGQGHVLDIQPCNGLHGATVRAQDLRGGAALAVAALAATGRTRIEQSDYMRRGYADLAQTLASLGAQARNDRPEWKSW
jgi:UDP-N-acetylglucosamine 1-carboxyvinyltransferase